MNREEAIKQIGEWYGGFANLPSEEAIHQVISDMQKLQKIKEVISKYSSPFASDIANGFYEIEQILKEV